MLSTNATVEETLTRAFAVNLIDFLCKLSLVKSEFERLSVGKKPSIGRQNDPCYTTTLISNVQNSEQSFATLFRWDACNLAPHTLRLWRLLLRHSNPADAASAADGGTAVYSARPLLSFVIPRPQHDDSSFHGTNISGFDVCWDNSVALVGQRIKVGPGRICRRYDCETDRLVSIRLVYQQMGESLLVILLSITVTQPSNFESTCLASLKRPEFNTHVQTKRHIQIDKSTIKQWHHQRSPLSHHGSPTLPPSSPSPCSPWEPSAPSVLSQRSSCGTPLAFPR